MVTKLPASLRHSLKSNQQFLINTKSAGLGFGVTGYAVSCNRGTDWLRIFLANISFAFTTRLIIYRDVMVNIGENLGYVFV